MEIAIYRFVTANILINIVYSGELKYSQSKFISIDFIVCSSLVFGGLSCLSLIVMNFIFVGVIASQHQLNPNIMVNQGP